MTSLKTSFIFIIFIKFDITATIYYRNNATKIFNYFKERYHKTYKNSTFEDQALDNFVKNLNKVNALNQKSNNNDEILVMNKHSDMNTDDFEDHFGVNVVPCEY